MPRGAPTARGSVKFGALRWLFARSDLLWQELSPAVVEQATTLRAQHGLRTPDALQAAWCLQLGQDAVMLSGDGDFERIAGLRLRLIR